MLLVAERSLFPYQRISCIFAGEVIALPFYRTAMLDFVLDLLKAGLKRYNCTSIVRLNSIREVFRTYFHAKRPKIVFHKY